MKPYNSEVAREVYSELKLNPHKDFPITAQIVDGILENFVYWHHTSYPSTQGETQRLTVSGETLLLDWFASIQKEIQELLNNKQKEAA